MFSAVREYFQRPDEPSPLRGRGRRVAGLFIFEFIVVVLGVLAAQLLQDWFGQLNDQRRAREVVAAFEDEARRFAMTAEFRLRTHECEVGRLARLTALTRGGRAASEVERYMPMMPMPVITRWEEQSRRGVERHFDPKVLPRYDSLLVLATMMSERQRQLENQWADFRLLDPDAGPIDPQNRATLALSAARTAGLLYAIDMNAGLVAKHVPGFKVDETKMAVIAKYEHPCAPFAARPVAQPEN